MTHILDRKTRLVHLVVSYDESDQAYLARMAGDLGHRTLCGRLEGVWVPRARPLTCFECIASEGAR